jgi:hypothetical protein
VPASGHINYMNVGTHEVTVFTTGPAGIPDETPRDIAPIGDWRTSLLEQAGVLQIQRDLPPGASSQTDVEAGQLVYIARADKMTTERTIAISLDHVP